MHPVERDDVVLDVAVRATAGRCVVTRSESDSPGDTGACAGKREKPPA